MYRDPPCWDVRHVRNSDFITINCSIGKTPLLTKEALLGRYPDRFKGLGTFKDMKPYHITLDPAAEPVTHPPRSVPVHLKDLYRKELDDMLNLGVITAVDRPTNWVNSTVLSDKKKRQRGGHKARSRFRPP